MVNTVLTGWKSKISERLVKALNLQTAIDKVPNELINTIQPVFNVEEEKELQVEVRTSTGTVLTASSTRRTFIVGWTISNSHSTPGSVIATATLKNGASKNLDIFLPSSGAPTSGYMGGSRSVMLPISLELLKGSTVSISVSGTSNFSLYYYEVD